MKSKWLLDEYMIKTSYHDDIRLILSKMGLEYHVEKYIPHSEKSETIPYTKADCVVLYGSINFVRQQIKNNIFTPGAYLEEKSMKCLGYMPFIDEPDLLANSNHVFTTFTDLIRRKNFFYDIFNTNMIFIRPNCGLKTFTGLPLHLDDFDREINSLRKLTAVMDDTLILVSSGKRILQEYRFFIVNREVVTGSQYKYKDKLSVKAGYSMEAYEVALKMAANKWQPDIAYACDVGIVNGVPKIIELNSFSCAGFYGCDIEKLIQAIDHVAVLEYNGDMSIGDI